MALLESYLRLDEDVMVEIAPDHAQRLNRIAEEAREDIENLLNDEQRKEFQKEGIRALLACTDYPGLGDFFCKLNELPVVGQTGDFKGLFCPRPFDYAEIGQRGQTFLCCPIQLPKVVGDATDGTFMDV